ASGADQCGRLAAQPSADAVHHARGVFVSGSSAAEGWRQARRLEGGAWGQRLTTSNHTMHKTVEMQCAGVRRRFRLLTLFGVLVLAGCAVGPDYQQPAQVVGSAYGSMTSPVTSDERNRGW